LFADKELAYKKRILFGLYGAVFVILSLFGLLNLLYFGNETQSIMIGVSLLMILFSIFLVHKSQPEAANHIVVSIFSLSVLVSQFLAPEDPLVFLALMVPLLLSGLLERTWVLIVHGSVILGGITMFTALYGMDTIELVSLIFVFSSTAVLMGFFNSYRQHLEKVRFQLLNHTIDSAIFILGYTTELRDEETGLHIDRVSTTSELIARELKKNEPYRSYLSEQYICDLKQASTLHDVGKVVIPDAILLKPGKLSDEEFEVIKTHTVQGADIIRVAKERLEDQTVFDMAYEIAMNHHERWDGAGYPRGLQKDKIPLSAQIVSVADVYDALMSKRCYKKAFPHETCVQLIREGRGSQFSPTVVDCFLEIAPKLGRLYGAQAA
jgi:HD-GYP domain-containing protein (c-di-GMP phosphodiesterase class II)